MTVSSCRKMHFISLLGMHSPGIYADLGITVIDGTGNRGGGRDYLIAARYRGKIADYSD